MAVSDETLQKYWDLQDEARANVMPYKEEKKGRGIVICGGGKKYFTCAWVCINVLRRLGCDLPVELWHLGDTEMDDTMRALVRPLNVKCVDAYKVREKFPVRKLGGWELNPYSIIHCSFEEVIFLDADNVPLVNPETLFDTPQYKETGAIFWPDFGRLRPEREIWKICRVPYRDEPEFESGQIVIDTRRNWVPMQMVMHLNEHSTDYYYLHIHGDKDTFHMGFHMCNAPYSMPSKPIHPLKATMCQHDFEGRRIFQHRNMNKWDLDGGNYKIRDFQMEDLCFGYVRDLRQQWDGKVGLPSPKTSLGMKIEDEIIRLKTFDYIRIGTDSRHLEFLPDHQIGEGAQRLEQRWFVREADGNPEICLLGDSNIICSLRHKGNNKFEGQWTQFEQMPVDLVPLEGVISLDAGAATVHAPPVPLATDNQPAPREAATYPTIPTVDVPVITRPPLERTVDRPFVEKDFHNRDFVYVRVGYDSRKMRTGTNSSFAVGSDSLETSWEFLYEGQLPCIVVKDFDGEATFKVRRGIDGVWRGKWLRFEKMDVMLVEVP